MAKILKQLVEGNLDVEAIKKKLSDGKLQVSFYCLCLGQIIPCEFYCLCCCPVGKIQLLRFGIEVVHRSSSIVLQR